MLDEIVTYKSLVIVIAIVMIPIIVFLKRLMLVQIDEKVAMMDGYISEIPNWKKDTKSHEYVDAITNKITSDLRSVYRIKHEINDDQIIDLKQRGKKLVNLMKNEQYDTSKIEAVLELFA